MGEDSGIESGVLREKLTHPIQLPIFEYQRDSEGLITDMKFSSKEKRASLKELLPGDYKLFVRSEGTPSKLTQVAYFLSSYNTAYINAYMIEGGENSLGFLITLLHESGHAVEFASGAPETTKIHSEKFLAISRLSLVDRYAKNNYQLTPEDLENVRNYLGSWLTALKTPEETEKQAFAKLQKNIRDIELIKTNEDYQKYKEENERACDIAVALDLRITERTAWKHALQAARRLKRQGIIDFGNRDLLRNVRESLITYQDGQDELWDCLQPDQQMVRDLVNGTT